MNMFFRLTALAGLLAIAGQTFAVEDITRADQIPVLKEETQHATVSERVTSRFTRSHYRQFDLDQAFSAKIFDRYLNLLDYSHNVLLASDVEQFAKKKTELGDELRSGKLDVFYDLYNLARKIGSCPHYSDFVVLDIFYLRQTHRTPAEYQQKPELFA